LRALGRLLLEQVRGEDIPSRYGGDEFIIVLPDVSREITHGRAGFICELAKHFHLKLEGELLELEAITLSLGVAAFPENGSTSAVLLKAVDDALYHAKHEGRCRVVMADSDSIDLRFLPQVAEANTPQTQDVLGECLL